jgi:3-isopropylmalate/(R)-2-methylmalate dehydratase large subunit
MSESKTIYDKIWESHLVYEGDDDCLLYIDRHLIHEVTSPQAFEGLRTSNRKVRSPMSALAVADHNIPTTDRSKGIGDRESEIQIQTLEDNCNEFGIEYIKTTDKRQGIVHIIGPEQGFTLPGLTIVCGDSHTSTHGAFGALAHGIGTSEVEHVLATQTLIQKKAKNFQVKINGLCQDNVTAKDLALSVIGTIGTAGGTGYVIEYTGEAVRSLSIEGRMTLCNLTIEAGARAGLIAPDEKTFEYLKDKPMSPKGEEWNRAVKYWKSLPSDEDAEYDKTIEIDAGNLTPLVTWGTSPEDVISIDGNIPNLEDIQDESKRSAVKRSLDYMNLVPGSPIKGVAIDRVFIGSCTNGRIEDLREAASILSGKKVSERVMAMVVPGSGLVKEQAEKEGLDRIFIEAGFEWREPGCSMCLAMNADKLSPKERCASTSNRNFEGRQGREGRTHLVSPKMAAAAAVAGCLADVREMVG